MGTPTTASRNAIIVLLAVVVALLCIIAAGAGALLLGLGPFQVAQAPTPTAEATVAPSPTEQVAGTPTPTVEAAATATSTSTPTNTPTATPTLTPTPVPAPVISSFTADASPINAGECTTVRWTTQSAAGGVKLEGSGVAASGEQSVCPPTSTRYTLVAEGAPGASPAEVSAQATVLVRITQVFNVNAGNSGHIIGGTTLNPNPNAGDTPDHRQRGAFMDWNITTIPAGSSIDFAALNLSDHDILGDPFGRSCVIGICSGLGSLKVGAVNYGTLDVGDAGLGDAVLPFQSLNSPPAAPLNVTDQVRSAFNEGRAFQLILFFQYGWDFDATDDAIRFSEAVGNNTLAVTYTPPAP